MFKQQEELKKAFMDRYEKIKSSEKLLQDSIDFLYTLDSKNDCNEKIKEFISKISEYNANTEDADTVKQILHEVRTKNREIIVAIAALNYSYDVAAFKASRMWLMRDVFKCFF